MTPLTARQLQVLREYAKTQSYSEAGARLGLTLNGVRMSLRRAYRKLGAQNAIEAFTALGWLRLPE